MRNRGFEFRLRVVCWLLAAHQPAAPSSTGTPISTGAATPTGAPAATGTPEVITSDDGLAQLTIPSSALPPGTRLSDVHVVKLRPNNQVASPAADLPFAYSRLEPDRLTWARPIAFTLGVTGQVNALPLLWLISLNGRQP
jgi:hypothetical protein